MELVTLVHADKPITLKLSTLINDEHRQMIINMANSSAIGTRIPETTLPQLVTKIGNQRFLDLVYSSALLLTIGDIPAEIESFWESSKVVALCASKIASYVSEIETEKVYMIGLFHACGALLMARKFPDFFDKTEDLMISNPVSVLIFEENYFGFHHGVMGYCIARYWQLPDAVCIAIYHHHCYQLNAIENNEARSLIAVLILSSYIVNEMWHQGAAYSDEQNQLLEMALSALDISQYQFEDIRMSVAEEVDFVSLSSSKIKSES